MKNGNKKEKKVKIMNEEIKNMLAEQGILQDDINELATESTCLFDDDNAKIVAAVFIDQGVNFKYEKDTCQLCKITIL